MFMAQLFPSYKGKEREKYAASAGQFILEEKKPMRKKSSESGKYSVSSIKLVAFLLNVSLILLHFKCLLQLKNYLRIHKGKTVT